MEPLSFVHDIIITVNGIVYQWSMAKNMEILVQNRLIQHFNLLNLTKRLYNTTSCDTINVRSILCRFLLRNLSQLSQW